MIAFSNLAILALGWIVCGFVVGTANHLIFQPGPADRFPAFLVSGLLWPIFVPIHSLVLLFRLVTRGHSLDDWLEFLDDLPRRWENRKLKKRRAKDIVA